MGMALADLEKYIADILVWVLKKASRIEFWA
jgi:hypothetical protein